MPLTRRELLGLGGAALAATALAPPGAYAQAPRRGGTLTTRGSRLLKHKAGLTVHEIQRHLAKQQYYVQIHSGLSVAAWENALKNYAPNLGYDLGGRLTAAWLDRA